MKYLLNLLSGLGQVMNPFGSLPGYRYPQIGDRARDIQNLAGDLATVERRLGHQTQKELSRQSHGKVNHRAASQ